MTSVSEEVSLVDQLVAELEALPASRAAALQVLRLVDDPETSSSQVAAAAAADPSLTARTMRLANSAYYGLSGRVRTPGFAVTVVGFETVRSLAAVAAADLAEPGALPPGFWERAAGVAAGASAVARNVGAPQAEAFCVGLLHDLGTALLRQHDRVGYDALVTAAAGREDLLLRTETRTYGDTHAGLCAQVLRGWQFPDDLADAIGLHHAVPTRSAPPLRRALQAGLALSDLVGAPRKAAVVPVALAAAGVTAGDIPALVEQVRQAGLQLASAMNG